MFSRLASLLVLLWMLAPTAYGQEFSSDGNRWVEVEVTVFRSIVPGRSNEVPNPGKLNLGYLPRVRPLSLAATSYAYPFADEQPVPSPATSPFSPASPLAPQVNAPEPVPEPIEFGAPHSPARAGAFRVTDYARDPFISLDRRSWQFGTINRNLDQSGEYQTLWHAVWRQPLLPRGQVPSVGIIGGEPEQGHTQLEGSLRLSDGGNQARVDLNLWLTEFGPAMEATTSEWQLPEMPQSLEAVAAEPATGVEALAQAVPQPPARSIIGIWQLERTRELTAGELYYIDHPVLGVILQTRPYVLPDTETTDASEDF